MIIMALAEIERAKRIKLFRNGDKQFLGKNIVVNRRQIKTWDAFLQAATSEVKATQAVRSICTPVGGRRVVNLDDLEDNCKYVAVANGSFKKAG